MALSDFYIASVYASTVQVSRVTDEGATVTQIGNDLTTSATEQSPDTTQSNTTNRVAEYKDSLYCYYREGTDFIFKKYDFDNPSADWVTVYTASTDSGDDASCGFFIVNIGGINRLIAVLENSDTEFLFVYTDDGTIWSSATASATSGVRDLNRSLQFYFRGKLYCALFGIEYYVLDLVRLTASLITTDAPWGSFNTGHNVYHWPFNNKLMIIAQEGRDDQFGSDNLSLWELAGDGRVVLLGNLFDLVATSYTNTISFNANNKRAFFKDPDSNSLILIATAQNVDYGSICFQINMNNSGITSVTDLTNTVIPSALRPNNGRATSAAADRWYQLHINEAGTEEIYFFYVQDATASNDFDIYKWNGTGSELTLVQTSAFNTDHAVPWGRTSGVYTSRNANNKAELISRQPVDNALRLSYRVYGAQTGHFARLYYGTGGQKASNLASLIRQEGGSDLLINTTFSNPPTITDVTLLFNLDASDSSSITADGNGFVSQWAERGFYNSNWPFEQLSSTNQPIYYDGTTTPSGMSSWFITPYNSSPAVYFKSDESSYLLLKNVNNSFDIAQSEFQSNSIAWVCAVTLPGEDQVLSYSTPRVGALAGAYYDRNLASDSVPDQTEGGAVPTDAGGYHIAAGSSVAGGDYDMVYRTALTEEDPPNAPSGTDYVEYVDDNKGEFTDPVRIIVASRMTKNADGTTTLTIWSTDYNGGRPLDKIVNVSLNEVNNFIIGGYRPHLTVADYNANAALHQCVCLTSNSNISNDNMQTMIDWMYDRWSLGEAVKGVDGDDGSQLFTIDWDFKADGLTNDPVNLEIDVTST